MKNQPLDILVCYDISEPSRLQRIHRCMCRWGLPLQYSVFYCKLTKKQRNALEMELRWLIDERQDDVRVYGLKSGSAIKFIGKRPYEEEIQIIGSLPLEEAHAHVQP